MMPWYHRLFPGSSARTADQIAASPDWYPAKLLLNRRSPAISFIGVDRDTYVRSSFLDHRIQQKPGAKKELCSVEQLLERYRNSPPGHAGFIFHVAYCCSTLLARYLELLPQTFVLKEPFLITQLAEMNRAGQKREDLTRLCVQLLARTYDPAETAIIKLADQCNAIAGALIAATGMEKCVFIGLELRSFLLAGLKTNQRRGWVRRRAQLAAIDVPPSTLARVETAKLDDSQACAYLWLAQGVLLQKLLNDIGRGRVLVIDGENISDNAEETVGEIARWFGLASAVLDGQIASHYSKNPAQAFTREDRRAEFAATYSRIAKEVDAATAWAESRAADLGLDCHAGRMLAGQRP